MRDPRWEKLHARVGLVEGYIYGDDKEPEDFVEFLIEVVYNGRVLYSRILAGKLEVEEPYVYAMILDRMVEAVDERLKDEAISMSFSEGVFE